MRLINLTPHPVNLVAQDGNILATIEPSGILARAAQHDVEVETIDVDGHSVAVVRTEFGLVSDLPEPIEGVRYIVSAILAQAAAGRTDLLLTSGPVRDESNRIVGCTRFAVL